MAQPPRWLVVMTLASLGACSARGGGGGGGFAPDGGADDRVVAPADDAASEDATVRDHPLAADSPGATDVPATADVPATRDAPEAPVDVPPTRCAAWQLAESPTELTLPTGFAPQSFRSYGRNSAACATSPGMPAFTPADVDADGRLDLLVTSRCGEASDGRWQAFLGTASGFGPSPRTLATPAGFPTGSLVDAFSGTQCTLSPPRPGYFFFDYTADRRPDVMMYAACGDPTVGGGRWRLFSGTAEGWANGSDLALPTGYPSGAFAQPLAMTACPDPSRAHRFNGVMDLDGDRLPDLAVYTTCDDGAVGTTHWRLHRNTRAGFASSPVRWGLPTEYGASFTSFVQPFLRCPAQPVVYLITDLDGDARPDLVVLRACSDGSVGQAHWRVHRNTGAGFATEPVRWALPPGYAPGAIDFYADGTNCAARQAVTAGMSDVDGDGRPDLLVTTDCADPSVGREAWKVHFNTGAGFAAEPSRVAIPTPYRGTDLRYASVGSVQCSPLSLPWAYQLVDADGDRVIDLLVTGGCSDARLGTAVWRVHRGTCR